MVKKVLSPIIKFLFTVLVLIVTYVGGLFFRRPKENKFDDSWETGRDRIFDLGIDYWENKLRDLGLIKQNIDVLEIGSGNGQWLIAFKRFANRVCGIEPGEEIRQYSLERFVEYHVDDEIEVLNAPAEKIPYENEIFDLLFCSGVFMFTKQELALKEFNRVLKPGGKLLITANGLGYFLMYIIRGMRHYSPETTKYGLIGLFNTFGKWIIGKQFGICAVNHSEMSELLNKHGFELVDTRLWLDMDLYPYEHFSFVTNYAFIARKK